MAWYEANFQRDYILQAMNASRAVSWERRRSQYNVFLINWILYWMVGISSEPLLYFAVEMWTFIKNSPPRYRNYTCTFRLFSSASRGTAWPVHFKFASYAYIICHTLLVQSSVYYLIVSATVETYLRWNCQQAFACTICHFQVHSVYPRFHHFSLFRLY